MGIPLIRWVETKEPEWIGKFRSMWQSEAVERMHAFGIARIPVTFDAEQVVGHFHKCEVYNAHVAAKAAAHAPFGAEVTQSWPMFCHSMWDTIAAPELLEKALELYPLVKEYFQEAPVLYSMNCFWTQPVQAGIPQYVDTHWWHRDGDDRKQLVVFFMGLGIPTKEDGAHLFQRGSHDKTDEQLGYDFQSPPEDVIEVVTGKAGSIFLSDPRGMHMAPRPAHTQRMLAWARYGVSDPPASYVWDKLCPMPKYMLGDRYPSDPELQQAIRLVVS